RRNQQAQPIGRRDQSEREAYDTDHGEMDRVHPDMLRHREEDGAENDDGRYRVDEHPDQQESQRAHDPRADDAKAHLVDLVDESGGDLEVRQAPPEGRGGSDAEEGDRGEPRAVIEDNRQLTRSDGAIDEEA